jgi:hypothetical protein
MPDELNRSFFSRDGKDLGFNLLANRLACPMDAD